MRLNEIKVELDDKIAQIEKLGGDVTELERVKAEVEAELKSVRKRSDKAIAELKDRVEGYEELLIAKDDEIVKLQSINKELLGENRNLKTKQNVLNDSINRLTKNTDALQSKVTLASQLKAENVQVLAVNSKGKERESPFRSRQLESLKVEFNIAENKVAPIEGKKIMIRVIDENGQPIFQCRQRFGYVYGRRQGRILYGCTGDPVRQYQTKAYIPLREGLGLRLRKLHRRDIHRRV